MRQAAYDYSDGNLVEMSDLLERHRPGSGPDDDWRGFEWNLLWKLLHRERLVLQRRNWVYTFAYTPDGRKLFTSDRDGQIETWDAATGQSLGNFASWPSGETWMSLAPDGKRLTIYGWKSVFAFWTWQPNDYWASFTIPNLAERADRIFARWKYIRLQFQSWVAFNSPIDGRGDGASDTANLRD